MEYFADIYAGSPFLLKLVWSTLPVIITASIIAAVIWLTQSLNGGA